MQTILLLLFILQIVQLNTQEKRFVNIVKRDVYSSSPQNLNRYIKTYENGQNIVLNTPNFTLIDYLLSTISTNKSKPSVREHATWLTRQISSNSYEEIARFDSIKHQFILHSSYNNSYTINTNSGQLTIINMNDTDLLNTEISIHAESGLSKGDDILHDIYRFIRLSTTSINCTTNITINFDESIEIKCTIEYEFFEYNDLDYYQPDINLTFYLKENNSIYIPINKIYLNKIEDLPIENNQTFNWKRSISYKIKSMNKNEINREYICIIIPDSLKDKNLFQNNNRSCRTRIDIRKHNSSSSSSTVIITRFDQLNLIDILILILIISSLLLFLISFILCIITRKYHKKRIVQIKPENKSLTLPLNTNKIVSNNNEIPLELSSEKFSSQHKPGCPKYLPSSEYNLLSNDLFTHTTIDNIKKIILPDISESTNNLFDEQTYIHFYIPSKTENISINK